MNSKDVVIVKLVNDTTLIGKLYEEDDNGIHLIDALKIDIMYYSKKPAVYFYEWDELAAENKVWLDKFHILYITHPKEKVLAFYSEQLTRLGTPPLTDPVDNDVKAVMAYMEKLAAANTSIN
jgi:hypothetical protein